MSARFNGAAKPSSDWRKGERSSSLQRGGIENNSGVIVVSQTLPQKPRSSSLNPLIYPSWWGDDVKEFKDCILRRERSHAAVPNRRTVGLPNRPPMQPALINRIFSTKEIVEGKNHYLSKDWRRGLNELVMSPPPRMKPVKGEDSLERRMREAR